MKKIRHKNGVHYKCKTNRRIKNRNHIICPRCYNDMIIRGKKSGIEIACSRCTYTERPINRLNDRNLVGQKLINLQ